MTAPDVVLPSGEGNSYGDGRGNGYGSGNGNGYGDGRGYGNGDGDDRGNGYGSGDGNGNGNGYGDGSGYGDGGGYSNGDGNGNGYGNGYGNGDGNGWGNGYGGYVRLFVSHDTPIEAYWVFGDENHPHMGQQLEPEPGDVHEWPYRVYICMQGLHASMDLKDAMQYRKGTAYKVLCSGWCQFQSDKLVCSRRVIVGRADN